MRNVGQLRLTANNILLTRKSCKWNHTFLLLRFRSLWSCVKIADRFASRRYCDRMIKKNIELGYRKISWYVSVSQIKLVHILGDPGADSGDEGKSKRAEKCDTKESKERREEPLGTMSYHTSSTRSSPFWLMIGARKLVFFWHQSEARTAATVWNWSGKSPGALLAVLYFSSFQIYFPPV